MEWDLDPTQALVTPTTEGSLVSNIREGEGKEGEGDQMSSAQSRNSVERILTETVQECTVQLEGGLAPVA